jgi:hypothetical protein
MVTTFYRNTHLSKELNLLMSEIGLFYDNRFAWISRWNLDWKIVEMRAYLDSFLVNKAITENESGQSNYTMLRTALIPGPMGLGCKAT